MSESSQSKSCKIKFRKPLSLSNVIAGSIQGRFFNLIKRNSRKKSMPTEIDKMTLVDEIFKSGEDTKVSQGVYQDESGKKFFVKKWEGNKRDFSYFGLQNEMMSYKIIGSVLDRLGANLPEKFSKIRVPRIIKCEKNKKKLLAVVEFLEGENVQSLSPKRKIETYFLISDFMNFLGEKMTKDERESFTLRSPANYAILHPFILGKSLLVNPNLRKSIVKGSFVFWKNLFNLVRNSETRFIHRDLHFQNILLLGDEIGIIDLEFCVFSDPLQELITTLRYNWNEKFGDLLLKEILERQGGRDAFAGVFRCLAANSVVHGLTDGDKIGEDDMKRYLDFLEFARENKHIGK